MPIYYARNTFETCCCWVRDREDGLKPLRKWLSEIGPSTRRLLKKLHVHDNGDYMAGYTELHASVSAGLRKFEARRPKPRIGGRKEITTASVMSLCPHEGDSDKVLFGLEALTIMGSLGATVAFNLKEGHEGFLDAGPKGDARRSGESRGGC
ncbi:hypothetical protein LTR02_011835 [Friedmanniomyces endolithicus]|nr:hypothetical protein LTR02_011835 [Friedmanniomyces endolithicus]